MKVVAGAVFGEWTVLAYMNAEEVHCRCSCGTLSCLGAGSLRNKKSTRCFECGNKLRGQNATYKPRKYKTSARRISEIYDLNYTYVLDCFRRLGEIETLKYLEQKRIQKYERAIR